MIHLALSLAAAVAQPAQPQAGMKQVTSVEGITEYDLDNGLRVLLFPDQSKMSTTVNMTYIVGSRNESYGETGMAHLLEHLMFKGSTRHTNVPQELTAHGARPNGTTDYDRTNYFETFKSTDENIAWALDLEADRMVNSSIAKKDLDSEMTVVRNEFEVDENNPEAVMQERLMETAYLWHRYGNPTIGAKSDVERVPIDRLQAFYKTWYQPDNAVLVVAGRFDDQKVLKLIAEKFGKIPKPTRVKPLTYTAEPPQDGERSVTLRRVGDTPSVAVGYHVPAGSSQEFASVYLLGFILGDSPSGRLYKALVETKKAARVGDDEMSSKEPGELVFSAALQKDGKLDDVTNTLTKTVEDIAKNPPTKDEVERARANYMKNFDLVFRDANRVGLRLSEYVAMGDWRLAFLQRDEIMKVKPEDVAAVAAKYLKSSNRTTASFVPTEKPERSEVPDAPDVAARVKDYKGGAAVAAGEAFDPSTTNVEQRTKRPEKLNGGLKLAFVPKKTRGGSVFVNLTLRMGDEKSLQNMDTPSSLAAAMLRRGTAKHTRQQIADEQDRLKSRIMIGGGGQNVSVSIETTRDALPDTLKLAAEMLKEPSFPAAELDTLKSEEIAALEEQRSDPRAKAQNAWQRHLEPWPKGDPRYVSTPDEDIADIKAAKLDDAKAFWKKFYGASNGELAIVGDFDEAPTLALVKQLFEGWKSPASYTRLTDPVKDVKPTNENIDTPDKTSAVWFAGERIAMRDDDADYPAMVLGNFMLGGGFLNSRLATRIRQKDGLSYGVGSQFAASGLDKEAMFMTYAIYNPAVVDKLEKAMDEEIEKAIDKGFTDDEIKEAKDGWLQSRLVSRSNDNELVRQESQHLLYDRTFAWDEDFEKKVEALKASDIQAALKKHLDWKKATVVKAGDFKKKQ
jgi:zinc protease